MKSEAVWGCHQRSEKEHGLFTKCPYVDSVTRHTYLPPLATVSASNLELMAFQSCLVQSCITFASGFIITMQVIEKAAAGEKLAVLDDTVFVSSNWIIDALKVLDVFLNPCH